MKKNRLFMMAGALCAALGLGSCSNEIEEVAVPADGATRTVTLTVTLPDRGADTRTAYTTDGAGLKVTWAEGDKLTAFLKDNTTPTFTLKSMSEDGKTATFVGELPAEVAEENNVYFYYPTLKSEKIDGETHYIWPDYRTQDGTLAGLAKLDAIMFVAQYSDGKLNVPSKWTDRYSCFLHFEKGTKIASAGGTATFTITGALAGFDQTAKANINENIEVNGVAVESDGTLKDDVYIAFEDGKGATLTITVGTENKAYSLDKEFEPGKMYNINDLSQLKEADPLTIEPTSNDITVTINNPLGLEIEYSVVVKGDETLVPTKAKEIEIPVKKGERLQLFGDNAAYAQEGNDDIQYTQILCSGESKVYGNIMSLIDSENYSTLTAFKDGSLYNFTYLFRENTGLTDASGLILPATTLTEACYAGMFWECSALTSVPALPATTLAKECYINMFYNCTSLTTAPKLPATTLAEGCYISMFYYCSKLATAPELNATTLAKDCYNQMFANCSALTTAPELPATSLADGCYANMFAVCKNLTSVPELKATKLARSCYAYMFSNCEALTKAPELKATTLAEGCYAYMFQSCTGLTSAPELPATTLADGCYLSMFFYCTNLEKAPELKAATLTPSCYAYMFENCKKLNSVTCLATDISAKECTDNWLKGVAEKGAFYKASTMTKWGAGASAIPGEWKVYDK